jgi:heptosyltransferase-3
LNGIAHFNWQTHHRVEKDFYTVHEFLPLKEPVPALVFEKSKTVPWAPAAELSDFVVIHPGTRWERKRWPEEKWLATCSWLLGKTKNIVISAGPDAAEIILAQRLQCVLGNAVLSTQGQCNWAQLAGLLSRAKLFVGVDTAAMHLAAACQCPSVALFGPSTVHEWRPWQVRHVLIEPQESNQIPGVVEDPRLAIRSIGVDPVKQACQKLLDAAN